MTKTKKTDTKLKETLEDEKMKKDNELFNQKLDKINKPILEMVKELNDLMKQVEEIEKGTEGKVFEPDLDYITRRLKDLSEYNEENFTELKKVAKQIQKKNLQILDSVLNEKQFKEFKKKGKIEVAINGAINEEQKKIVESLNGKFITEKTLLIFPFWIEGGIKQDELKLFQEDFENVSKQVEEKRKLLDKYYQYQSRIILTNNQVGQIQALFFDILPKYQGQELSKDTIDLTNENVFNFFSDIQEKINNAKIEEKTLFELATDTESDYKISFVYDEEKKETRFTFEKGINISGSAIDILNPRIQELEKENKELKKKLQKQEEPEEIEILSDFKPIPIDKQITFTNKLANIGSKLNNGKWAELTNQGGKSKKMKNLVEKVFVENGEMKTSKPLTDFDILILDTIYTLLQENKYFDIQMIKKHLIKREERHRMKLDKDIEQSIEKLRITFIEIQSPVELEKTYKKPFDKMGIRETILPLREFYVIKGGQKKKVFAFTNVSIYFLYAEAKGQLMTKESKYLEVKIGKKGKNELVLIDKISTRVKDMKRQRDSKKLYNGQEYIDTILFDYLLENLDYNEENIQELSLEAKKQRYLKIAEKILNEYKKNKIIKSSKMEINSFKITLYTQEQEKKMNENTK